MSRIKQSSIGITDTKKMSFLAPRLESLNDLIVLVRTDPEVFYEQTVKEFVDGTIQAEFVNPTNPLVERVTAVENQLADFVLPKLQELKDELDEKVLELQEVDKELRKDIDINKDNIEILRTDVDKIINGVDTTLINLKTLEDYIKSNDIEIEKLKSDIIDINEQLVLIKEDIANLTKLIEDLTVVVTTLKDNFEKFKETTELAIETINTEITDIKIDIEDIVNELSEIQEKIENIKNDFVVVQTEDEAKLVVEPINCIIHVLDTNNTYIYDGKDHYKINHFTGYIKAAELYNLYTIRLTDDQNVQTDISLIPLVKTTLHTIIKDQLYEEGNLVVFNKQIYLAKNNVMYSGEDISIDTDNWILYYDHLHFEEVKKSLKYIIDNSNIEQPTRLNITGLNKLEENVVGNFEQEIEISTNPYVLTFEYPIMVDKKISYGSNFVALLNFKNLIKDAKYTFNTRLLNNDNIISETTKIVQEQFPESSVQISLMQNNIRLDKVTLDSGTILKLEISISSDNTTQDNLKLISNQEHISFLDIGSDVKYSVDIMDNDGTNVRNVFTRLKEINDKIQNSSGVIYINSGLLDMNENSSSDDIKEYITEEEFKNIYSKIYSPLVFYTKGRDGQKYPVVISERDENTLLFETTILNMYFRVEINLFAGVFTCTGRNQYIFVFDAPSDGKLYSRQNGQWIETELDNVYTKDETDELVMAGDVEVLQESKKYTDDEIQKLGKVISYRGHKTTLAELLSITDQKAGDFWLVGDPADPDAEFAEYVWSDDLNKWEFLGTLGKNVNVVINDSHVGEVKAWVGEWANANDWGWFIPKGQYFKLEDYPEMYNFLFNSGSYALKALCDGEGFMLPDWTARYLRQFGQADASRNAGVPGVVQDDAMQRLTGTFNDNNAVGIGLPATSGSFFRGSGPLGARFIGDTVSGLGYTVAFDNALQARTDTENRPISTTVVYYIKLKNIIRDRQYIIAAPEPNVTYIQNQSMIMYQGNIYSCVKTNTYPGGDPSADEWNIIATSVHNISFPTMEIGSVQFYESNTEIPENYVRGNTVYNRVEYPELYNHYKKTRPDLIIDDNKFRTPRADPTKPEWNIFTQYFAGDEIVMSPSTYDTVTAQAAGAYNHYGKIITYRAITQLKRFDVRLRALKDNPGDPKWSPYDWEPVDYHTIVEVGTSTVNSTECQYEMYSSGKCILYLTKKFTSVTSSNLMTLDKPFNTSKQGFMNQSIILSSGPASVSEIYRANTTSTSTTASVSFLDWGNSTSLITATIRVKCEDTWFI